MSALPLLRHTARIAVISAIAASGFATTSCVSQSEKDFKAQHGFKRTDYFGDKNLNYVPRAARKPRTVDTTYAGAQDNTAGFPIK